MVWDAPMSTVTVWPFAMGVPVLQRVAGSPSSIRAATSPPPVADADADQPVRGSTPCPVPPGTVVCPVRRMSREEEPTEMVLVPAALVQAVVQYWKLRASRV